jgi:glucose/mannose-6-phosphate isomerase
MASPQQGRKMTLLDNAEKWSTLDPKDMYGCINDFAAQTKAAIEIGRSADLTPLAKRKLRHIVVAGLGGSAIGGDLVRSYLADTLEFPMLVVRDYVLPKFVGPDTLVIASSYSGTTEETLAAYDQANAVRAPVMAITTGGELGKRAQADGHTVIAIPSGLQPRAALGYSFFPMLIALSRLGLCQDQTVAVTETHKLLDDRRRLFGKQTPQVENPAKVAAAAWSKHIPIIYSCVTRFDAVAVRIKGQICENAKQLAFANVFPEFNHNELVGYGKLGQWGKLLTVTIIRDRGDHRRTGIRMAIVRKLIADLGIPVAEVESVGESPLARMFSIIQWGDFASLYLAMLNGVDPTPVAVIDHLKHELSQR